MYIIIFRSKLLLIYRWEKAWKTTSSFQWTLYLIRL